MRGLFLNHRTFEMGKVVELSQKQEGFLLFLKLEKRNHLHLKS